MEENLSKIIKGFEEALGSNWKVTPHPVFNVVYYFDCEIGNQHFLTGSYGIYAQTDVTGIIKKETERVKTLYRQYQQVNGVTS